MLACCACNMISQFFILSPRGDTIITRDYLGNVPKARAKPGCELTCATEVKSSYT